MAADPTPQTAAGLALYLSGVLQDDVAGARILPAILAIEAEAAAPALDVERLQVALMNHGCHADCGEWVAAEYARLSADEEGGT